MLMTKKGIVNLLDGPLLQPKWRNSLLLADVFPRGAMSADGLKHGYIFVLLKLSCVPEVIVYIEYPLQLPEGMWQMYGETYGVSHDS